MTDFEKILTVVRKHHLLTLATVGKSGRPWVAHAFYAWSKELECFVFTTDPATRHGGEMVAHPSVAAGIGLETRNVGKVQGVQIEGEVRRAGDDVAIAKKGYLKKFPFAVVMDLNFWLLSPISMKLTDNTLGFGSKVVWER